MGHCISLFRKDNDEFAGKIPLDIDINILQKKYNSEAYDPMLYYSYPIKPDDICFFLPFIDGYKFDLANFDYFLDYEEDAIYPVTVLREIK